MEAAAGVGPAAAARPQVTKWRTAIEPKQTSFRVRLYVGLFGVTGQKSSIEAGGIDMTCADRESAEEMQRECAPAARAAASARRHAAPPPQQRIVCMSCRACATALPPADT